MPQPVDPSALHEVIRRLGTATNEVKEEAKEVVKEEVQQEMEEVKTEKVSQT